LAAGATRGLNAGESRRTGTGRYTSRHFTRGGTTTVSRNEEDEDYQIINGERVCVRPKPLYPRKDDTVANMSKIPEDAGDSQNYGRSVDQRSEVKDAKDSQKKDEPGDSNKQKVGASKGADKTDLSMQSVMSSSLVETSEDEEAKRKEKDKAKGGKKGELSTKELDKDIDIEIAETETITILFIPGNLVNQESEDFPAVDASNKKYEQLLQNKIGSDNYKDRGSQTINLTQKSREASKKVQPPKSVEIQASWWDIYDSAKRKQITEDEKMNTAYFQEI
jgi:hypothetical protein